MPRFLLSLCLLAVLLTSCSTSATPVPDTTNAPILEPTMSPAVSAPQFIILANATDGSFVDANPSNCSGTISLTIKIFFHEGSINHDQQRSPEHSLAGTTFR